MKIIYLVMCCGMVVGMIDALLEGSRVEATIGYPSR